MKTLYIIRGLPGSGKSTLAKSLVSPHRNKEADMYFISKDGVYDFDVNLLEEAHTWCQEAVETLMKRSENDCAVSNTFSRKWEIEHYTELAEKYGFTPVIIECQNNFGSAHNVPQSVVDDMIKRWESYRYWTLTS